MLGWIENSVRLLHGIFKEQHGKSDRICTTKESSNQILFNPIFRLRQSSVSAERDKEGEGERRTKRKEQRRTEGKKMRKEKNGELYLRAPFQPAGAGFNTFQ